MATSYFIVTIGIVLAKFLGLFRDAAFASVFGTTALTDIYFQVFGLVTLIFTSVGLAFQTILIKNMNKKGIDTKEKQETYVCTFITKVTLFMLALLALLYLLSAPLTRLLLPDIDSENFLFAVKLMHIMLPSFLFVVIAYIMSGALQNRKVFFITSIVSLPYNVLILASLVFPGISIETIGFLTTLGWFLHIMIQLPAFYKAGYRLFSLRVRLLGKTRVNTEVVFIFISNMMVQLCFVIDKAFVSGHEGMITSINYASNLFMQISSVFVVAMTSVVFPSLSQNYESGNMDKVQELLRYIITVMLSVFVAFLLVVSVFGTSIIRLVYERGSFTVASTGMTAMVFVFYCFGVFGYIAQEELNKILYLGNRYLYTVLGAVAVLALKVLIDSQTNDVRWIAGSTTILLTAYSLMTILAIRKVIGAYLNRTLLTDIGKILLSGAVALIFYFGFRFFAPSLIAHRILFIIPLCVCGLVYIGMLYGLKILKVILQKGELN
ncbi:MAG: lipid II flippase MurJ [Clostridia bacterium]|nr:lipid II flippase MurJ [Clostridia bacterium]